MNHNVFISALDDFAADFGKITGMETEVLAHKEKLKGKLEGILRRSEIEVSEKNNLLFGMVNDLKTSTQQAIDAWDQKLLDLLPMKALSEQYADRIIFLIFGKVNAGKSSFANFLTEQFPSDQVKRFCFENGAVSYFQDNESFTEGVTETTATIQGVELGKNFVLLDSPGLHSITAENGALTQKFIDSTDAVLWLTPSTSPGQVQELNDLKIELEKHKPLQPVITRSDFLEEDECETTGDLINVLKNKSQENRQLQEQDVLARLKDSNLTVPVKEPVSISVHAYAKHGKTPEALNEAGLTALLEKMVPLIDEAKTYKVGKAKNQMINFLEKEIFEPLDREIKPKIDSLTAMAEENATKLKQKQKLLTVTLMADIVSEIPGIIHKHEQSQDKGAIVAELNHLIVSQINEVLQGELSDFVSSVQQISRTLSSNAFGDFEDITIDVAQVTGSGWRSASSGGGGVGGAWGGAALGSALLPGIGTVVGGLLGAVLGSLAGAGLGEAFVETKTVTEKVGVSSSQMISKTTKTVKETLPSMIDDIFRGAIGSVQSVQTFAKTISDEIARFSDDIQTLKGVKL